MKKNDSSKTSVVAKRQNQVANSHVVSILPWEVKLYKPYRYKILGGGRGSGKSTSIANNFIRSSFGSKGVYVCAREYLRSLKYSVHSLLKNRIEVEGLKKYFNIKEEYIENLYSGNRMIFTGLQNIDSIKSIDNIDKLWIEEGDTLSSWSWEVLTPSVRNDNSEIYVSFNPKNESDVIYDVFFKNSPPEFSYVGFVNYWDNPYFPEISRREMEHDKKKDYGLYLHKWEGKLLTNSDSQVFKNPENWVVDKFEEEPNVFLYFGLDFGFSQAPTAAVRCYIKDNKLFITHEAVKLGLEIDETASFLEERLPDMRRYTIYADSASPIAISYIKRQGYSIKPVKKGKGSIEDGVKYMKSFDRIIVHERCKYTIDNLQKYSYKVDPRSGNISSILVDANNDLIDATRYALENCMINKSIDYSKWLD